MSESMIKAPIVLQIDGLAMQSDENGEPIVRDVDLAKRLGYREPRMVRKLIRRLVETAEIEPPHVRSTVERTSMPRGGERAMTVEEFWLDEDQALAVCQSSQTSGGIAMRKFLRGVYRQFRDQLADEYRRATPVAKRLIDALLLPKPADEWERMFQPSLVRALCALYRQPYVIGKQPRFLGQIYRMIYESIFSADGAREIKQRNPVPEWGSNHHQLLTPEARAYLARQLAIVEVLADQSGTKTEFWARMDRKFGGGLLQLALGKVGT